MSEAVIVDAVRTPIGRAFKGSLVGIRPDDLGAYIVNALLERNEGLDPGQVDDLVCGCGIPQRSDSDGSGDHDHATHDGRRAIHRDRN